MSGELHSHAGHWGAYSVQLDADRLVGVAPFEADRDPSPLLSSVPDAVHAANRVRRPAVRASWLAGRRGRRGTARRGTEPFVEVGWDEALDLVADALRQVYQRDGPAAVFGGSYGWSSAGRLHHAKTQLAHLLACAGGFTGQLSNYSYAAADAVLPYVVGDAGAVNGQVATWSEIAESTDTLLMFGGAPAKNMQVEPGGVGAHTARLGLLAALDAGTRVINVNPVRSGAPEHPSVSWLPIRPNTDTALILALLRRILVDGHVDQAFLRRCTVGMDRLERYLQGVEDGVVKTEQWAAAITGVAEEAIRELAATITDGRTMITATWSLQRADHGEQPYWAVIALAAALGQIGLPGGGFGFGYGCISGIGAAPRSYGTPAFRARPNPVDSAIPVARIADMLLHPGAEYEFNGQLRTYPEISFIYWAGGNPFHHHQDLNRLTAAWQRPETVVVNEPWWTATAKMADVVLPATTTLERDDVAAGSKDPYVIAMKRAIDPVGEARNDRAIFAAIAERLGVVDAFTEGQSDEQALRAMYETARATGLAHHREMPDFDTFWQQGFFEHRTDPLPPRFADFRADPERHPLATPSGRIEIFSDTVAGFGYDDCPGHPVWLPPAEWLGSAPARYPIHLLSPQPETRLHSQLDMGRVSLEAKVAGREPCTLHPADAARRGIRSGDLIRLWNGRGEVYAGARICDEVLEGVALLATGAWYSPEEPGKPSADLHGNPNVLTRDVGTSRLAQGPSAQTVMVEIAPAAAGVPPSHPHALPELRGKAGAPG